MTRPLTHTVFRCALALLTVEGIHAAPSCRNSDFRGVFGALALGDFVATAPVIPNGPTARVGRVEADGDGNSTIQATLSLNGAILKEDYGGTYSIQPDCTVNVTLMIPFPGAPGPIPFRFFGVLSDDGRQMDIILLDPPGTTVRIILRKQHKANCNNSDLSGGYLLHMSGTNVQAPGTPAGPMARVGRLEFDGAGGFVGDTQASYGGRVTPEKFAGNYTVDSSCRFTLIYNLGVTYSWAGMLIDNSSAATVLVAEPQGAVITGMLKAQ